MKWDSSFQPDSINIYPLVIQHRYGKWPFFIYYLYIYIKIILYIILYIIIYIYIYIYMNYDDLPIKQSVNQSSDAIIG